MKIGVCVLILGTVDGEERVLIVERKDGSGYCLPGGKPEIGEGCAYAASRELEEETGVTIPPTRLEFLYEGDDIPGWTTYCYRPQFRLDTSKELKPQPGEPPAKWGTWEDLFAGPYEAYNRKLYEVFNGQSSKG